MYLSQHTSVVHAAAAVDEICENHENHENHEKKTEKIIEQKWQIPSEKEKIIVEKTYFRQKKSSDI